MFLSGWPINRLGARPLITVGILLTLFDTLAITYLFDDNLR